MFQRGGQPVEPSGSHLRVVIEQHHVLGIGGEVAEDCAEAEIGPADKSEILTGPDGEAMTMARECFRMAARDAAEEPLSTHTSLYALV